MKYNLLIEVGAIEAETPAEAKEKARSLLEGYAESNDGSELLANAEPLLEYEPARQLDYSNRPPHEWGSNRKPRKPGRFVS